MSRGLVDVTLVVLIISVHLVGLRFGPYLYSPSIEG